jgi:hypothetical protein
MGSVEGTYRIVRAQGERAHIMKTLTKRDTSRGDQHAGQIQMNEGLTLVEMVARLCLGGADRVAMGAAGI